MLAPGEAGNLLSPSTVAPFGACHLRTASIGAFFPKIANETLVAVLGRLDALQQSYPIGKARS